MANEDNLTPFKPKRQKTGGRKKGTPNKITKFKFLFEEMQSRGVDLYQLWIDAINKGDDKIANAISHTFPHISQKPREEIDLNADIEVNDATKGLSATETKALLEALRSKNQQG